VSLHTLRFPRERTFPTVPAELALITTGIILQFMSGHSGAYFLPIPLDRPLILAGLMVLIFKLIRARVEWRPKAVHVAMLAFIGWILLSMVWSGSLTSAVAVFAWVDAAGILPFAIYLVAPVVYSTPQKRLVLLVALTLLGAYLGLIALLEGLGLYQLVWPKYIYDPGSPHFGRAGGPADQVASNGLQLMGCAMAAVAVSLLTTSRWVRHGSRLVAVLCLVGTFFTLTRSVWLGVMAGIVAGMVLDSRSRRALVKVAVVASAALVSAWVFIEPLRTSVQERLGDEGSAFDRINANATALEVVVARPLLGLGFQQFPEAEAEWLWQSSSIPIASTGIAVHNVLLGYAAELGLLGAALWIACLALPALYAWRSASSTFEMKVLRRTAIAYVACWLVVSMLVPLTYALPATLFWLSFGLVTDPARLGFHSVARVTTTETEGRSCHPVL